MYKYNLTIGTEKRNQYMFYKEENDDKNKIIEALVRQKAIFDKAA